MMEEPVTVREVLLLAIVLCQENGATGHDPYNVGPFHPAVCGSYASEILCGKGTPGDKHPHLRDPFRDLFARCMVPGEEIMRRYTQAEGLARLRAMLRLHGEQTLSGRDTTP